MRRLLTCLWVVAGCGAEADAPAPEAAEIRPVASAPVDRAPAAAPAPAAEPAAEPAAAAAPAPTPAAPPAATPGVAQVVADPAAFREAIRATIRMPRDRELQRAARAHKMRIVNLTWEDTGRWLGSAVGPNISDMTLEVIERREGRRRPRTHLLPVLRYPNFTDRTADLPAERVYIRVGNQREGAPLESARLSDVLANLRDYLSVPESLRSENDDFTAPRDTHYLVSAQHVYVPVPDATRVEFAPMLFNYQSSEGTPAVLVLLATREGTSIQVIENRPDSSIPGGWGQRLYYNRAGRRTTFTAERRSDVAERIERGEARPDDATALQEGADMVMVIQVPLVVPMMARGVGSIGTIGYGSGGGGGYGVAAASPAQDLSQASGRAVSDVENAVVGHGLDEGPFNEIRRRRIRRDRRFPVRVTIQFYRATSNGVVSQADLESAVAQIERVYNDADFVGSLVVGSQNRPTSWVAGNGE